MDLFSESLRSSCSEMFFKMGVLKIFENFTKNTCVGVFLSKVTGLQACNFIKNKLQHGCFRVKFHKFLKKSFFFTEHLWWLLMGTGIHVNTKFFESSSILEELGFVAFEKLKY